MKGFATMRSALLSLTILAAGTSTAASAALTYTAANLPQLERTKGDRTAQGSSNGLTWTARNTIIGGTPTSNVPPAPSPAPGVGGGDPIYKPSANKSGVVALIMTYADGARFICSGSVLGDGMSIATAGHCVSDGAGTANPVSTTAYFFDGDADVRTPFKPGGVSIDVTRYFVNPNYTGEVIDQNDIAVLRLATAAPSSAERYDLYTSEIKGQQFNVAGYGTRSTVGGATGNTPPDAGQTGFLREGDNIYDYAWGDALFQGFFTDRDANGENFFGTAEVEFSYISDFDNGLAAQDQARRIANALGLGAIGDANFADTGLGAREVGIAGGDSGGPAFIDGKLASINSYGLTFGTAFGDFGGGLNSGWGEFSGYVPVFIHTDFIASAMAVPEPSSWAMMIAGFGLSGAAMRRQRKALAKAA
ncbi:hypothetical protein GGQ62_000109 [Polymorphobacter fuscus]|nr:PEPxxWA-CTERM sorting domain-containing protein [Polymorphobacter fuscus]NJC07111.1 hypothetical protein [Polymorphobacter fuscus]